MLTNITRTIYHNNPGVINTQTTTHASLDFFTASTTNPINMNKIQQTKVVVFKVTRNEENEITNTEFIKEMWIQTKAGISVEFEAGRDKDLTKYDSSELVIKQITSTIFQNMPYIILKYIKTETNKIPVIMLDTNDEVWEFKDKEEAEHVANILSQNSITGKEYEVKKV